MSGTEGDDGISVTERASIRATGTAPADATVHTRTEADSTTPPPALRHESLGGHGSGSVLPNLRNSIRTPPARDRQTAPSWKLLLAGGPAVGIVVFFAVLLGLPAVACCIGGMQGEELPAEPTEVDGVPVRRGFK